MMMKMKKYSVVLAMMLFASASAHAAPRFSIVGGTDYNLDSASASVGPVSATVKGGLGIAGGLLVQSDSFEVGFLYISRKYTTQVTGRADTSDSITSYELPVMYRTHGGGSMTFGLGGFIDTGDSSNYGLSAGPRFGGTNGGLFLDVRFNYGLKDDNTKDVVALLGFALGK